MNIDGEYQFLSEQQQAIEAALAYVRDQHLKVPSCAEIGDGALMPDQFSDFAYFSDSADGAAANNERSGVVVPHTVAWDYQPNLHWRSES